MKILLAVQSTDLRLALDLLLREEPGAIVVGSTCSSEGLQALLRTVEPDLIIMQWQRPGLRCAEVLAEARTLAHPPRFLVLGTRPADEAPALSAGADAFVLIGDPPHRLLSTLEALRPHAKVE